ncbi:hypothetical protein DFQ27_008106 [Actinomortierella ambigua]|uniref:Uncharacterized protein n=1 Tax=Actinomortierella ambigua TaxID=1343610 RepID=A0A9P6PR74_9FUNG|nr:hypothetical protein DFQ27_008106 [Actinomortierella ambigua]
MEHDMEHDNRQPWQKLPMECHILIVECLGHDLSSLASLLQVNKAMFALVAPRLYQDPFALINERFQFAFGLPDADRTDRYKKLFVTLFHGILEPIGPMAITCKEADAATVSRAVDKVDLSHAPNRYLDYYTHVNLSLLSNNKRSLFWQIFSPKLDSIGLPFLGTKNMLKYQSKRITSLRLPLRMLKTFRPYQQTPTFPDLELFSALHSLRRLEITDTQGLDGNTSDPDHQLNLWHGLRDGIALRREDLGEDCQLDTLAFLVNYAVIGFGPGDVVRAVHPGLHSLVVQAITNVPYLLDSFSDAAAHKLCKLSFVMDTTPLLALLPLLQRFHQLEELSIFVLRDGVHSDVLNLKSLASQLNASDSTTMTRATLPVKRLRVLYPGDNDRYRPWLQDAIALCASSLEELTVMEFPRAHVGRQESDVQSLQSISWLNCRLPNLVSLTFVSDETDHPLKHPPFCTQPSSTNASNNNIDMGIVDPVSEMLPNLTSLSVVHCGYPVWLQPNLQEKTQRAVLSAVTKMSTLKHLLLDMSSRYWYPKLPPKDVFDFLPRGLHTLELGVSGMETDFQNGLRQAYEERRQQELQDVMDARAQPSEAVWRPIPKITTIVPPKIDGTALEDAFWHHVDIREYFFGRRRA